MYSILTTKLFYFNFNKYQKILDSIEFIDTSVLFVYIRSQFFITNSTYKLKKKCFTSLERMNHCTYVDTIESLKINDSKTICQRHAFYFSCREFVNHTSYIV